MQHATPVNNFYMGFDSGHIISMKAFAFTKDKNRFKPTSSMKQIACTVAMNKCSATNLIKHTMDYKSKYSLI